MYKNAFILASREKFLWDSNSTLWNIVNMVKHNYEGSYFFKLLNWRDTYYIIYM